MTQETLIVASKVKQLIKDASGMNTSASIVDALSSLVAKKCKDAIEKAKKERRKTVMARDFEA